MRNYLIAITLVAMPTLYLVGCSQKKENAEIVVNSTAASPTIKVITLARNIPSEIKAIPSENTGRCAVDIVNEPVKGDVARINRKAGLSIYGWALDEKRAVVSPIVLLQLTNGVENYYGQLNRRGDRGDLATAFGNPEFVNAGFGGIVDIASLPAGLYEIYLIQNTENLTSRCATNKKIELSD